MDHEEKKNHYSIWEFLFTPVDASSLGAFRFFFGFFMVWSTLRLYLRDRIEGKYLGKLFYFTYELFPWVTPWSGEGMYIQFAIMGLAALFLAVGLFTRGSALVFTLSYTYVFLIEKIYYNNHYYLICLLGFLFCIVHSNRWMSLDNWLNKKFARDANTKLIPYWNVFLFKAQIFIVYFYGGLAKINHDWLRGEPIRHWIRRAAGREDTPSFVSAFLETELATYIFSFGGLIFDLGIGFLLVYKKTRLIGFGLLLIFNLTNSWLFTIGIFPFLMIAATVIFLEPDTPRVFIQKIFPKTIQTKLEPRTQSIQNTALIFICIYLTIQILLPFRHFLYKGNVAWTEEGHSFSWRMKLKTKSVCKFQFMVTNPKTGDTWPFMTEKYLEVRQNLIMCRRPDMIIQFVRFMESKLKSTGIKNPIITIQSTASLNFGLPQTFIDPNVNLAKAEYSIFKHAEWILPLKR
ncbi:MAG: HTTM domain-containing protein [Nitrospinales bacterium]